MSLVAYEASSDEGTESESEELSSNTRKLTENGDSVNQKSKSKGLNLPPPKTSEPADCDEQIEASTNDRGHISDEEEYFPDPDPVTNGKNGTALVQLEANPIHFGKLPIPKTSASAGVVEEEDEFLYKKASPALVEKPPAPPARVPVKITIPSLAEFKDLDKEDDKKAKLRLPQGPSLKSCGLLNLLPRPKNEQVFTKTETNAPPKSSKPTKTTLIPDSVKNRQAKSVAKAFRNPLKPQQRGVANNSDSEGSDSEGDFFSLNSKQVLPQVSEKEINSMIAQRVAKMAEATSKFDEMLSPPAEEDDGAIEQEVQEVQEEICFDEKALHALVGSSAKRRKVEVNVVELSSEQVLPNKDEWLRSALAQATTYQPKGVLVDEEPVPGTRKKHQITYLAHQAKANELELQAMWSANRHTRRQTQSKYGF